jgi:ornithine carbamoyltransferase
MTSPSPSAKSSQGGRSSADAIDARKVASRGADAPSGATPLPLGNRNVGILCADPQRREAFLLQRAASDLGARVALVRSDLDDASGQTALEHTARVLSMLYDAVICVDLPLRIVDQLRDAAGIPVLSDVPGDNVFAPAAGADAGDELRLLLQPLLVGLQP